jgi:hypothetical protein
MVQGLVPAKAGPGGIGARDYLWGGLSARADVSPFALARGIENNGNSAVDLVEIELKERVLAGCSLYANNSRFRKVGFWHETRRRRREVSLTLYFGTKRPRGPG